MIPGTKLRSDDYEKFFRSRNRTTRHSLLCVKFRNNLDLDFALEALKET